VTSPTSGRPKSREEIAKAYKSEPWWYDVRGFFILTFAYNSTLPEQVRLFGRNMGARHLDLACGTGTLLDLILKWRRWKGLPDVQIVGVDYAEAMLAGAMRRFAGKDNMRFEHGDAAALPFAAASFDTVNIANALHCMPDVNGALAEAFRVLAPGGTMAVNVLLFPEGNGPFGRLASRINNWGIRKGILYTPYTRDDMRARLVSAGFELSFEATSGNCYNVIARRPSP
jgi:ubiquinone/menaquinone biosynthesis C-methylase UbiE